MDSGASGGDEFGIHKGNQIASVKDVNSIEKQKTNARDKLVSLRKERMNQGLTKKRTEDLALQENTNTSKDNSFFKSPANDTTKITLDSVTIDFNETTARIMNYEDNELFKTIQEIRKVLSSQNHIIKNHSKICIKKIVASDFLPFIIQKLGASDNEQLNYEITWILTNIAAGTSEQTLAVYNHRGLEQLMKKIMTPISLKLIDQILWAIANVIGDGPLMRDAAMQMGIIPIIEKLVFDPQTNEPSINHNISWMISNILRYSTNPISDDILKQIFEILKHMLNLHAHDTSVVFDIVWSFNYSLAYAGGPQMMIEYNFHIFLLRNLKNSTPKIQKTSLKTLASMTNTPDDIIQHLLDNNIIDEFANFFLKIPDSRAGSESPNPENNKSEVLLGLSNIALCRVEQKKQLTDHSIFNIIITQFENFSDKIKHEASFIIAHILQTEDVLYIKEVMQKHPLLLKRFFDSIKTRTTDNHLVIRNLDALLKLLDNSEALGINMVYLVESEQVLDTIEELQNHKLDAIYKKCFEIIEKHFGDEDLAVENIDENLESTRENKFFFS